MLSSNLKVLFFFGLLFAFPFAKALEQSEVLYDGQTVSGVKVIKGEQPDAELTVLGITLKKSTLNDVETKMGKAKLGEEGDAGLHTFFFCYKGSDGTVLTFESNGEMGGQHHSVTLIGLFAVGSNYRFEKKCARSNKISRKTVFGKIKVGVSKEALEKTLGTPSKASNQYAIYSYLAEKNTQSGNLGTVSKMEAKFERNRLSQFIWSKVESY